MAKNLIPEIAKMLGVELGEEFKIDKYDGLIFKFVDNKLMTTRPDGKGTTWVTPYATFNELVGGEVGVIKLPWQPKKGDVYWTFNALLRGEGKWAVTSYTWKKLVFDNAMLKAGWIFRTQEDAEAALPAVAKEMGVEYEI